ncbi:hypothetical protein GCM10010492_53540 [Saccharothrix mutabilis subsp. mutabilis]|uniref:Uncharacterized protein n=1 Tax=Saccharothrix mutabilis subsp. mutabilis TaxID=66855 RepID=A0ABP3E287_9PSEU
MRGVTIRVDATSAGTAYVAVDGAGWWHVAPDTAFDCYPRAHTGYTTDGPFTATPPGATDYGPSPGPLRDGRRTTALTFRPTAAASAGVPQPPSQEVRNR